MLQLQLVNTQTNPNAEGGVATVQVEGDLRLLNSLTSASPNYRLQSCRADTGKEMG